MEKEEKQREHVDMQDAFDALMGGLLTNVKAYKYEESIT